MWRRQKTDDYSSKEDVKAMELPTNSQEPDSSTASTSSGATADMHTTVSPQSTSPAPSTLSKQSPTPITEYQIPPLPSTLSKQSCCCQQRQQSTIMRPLRTS